MAYTWNLRGGSADTAYGAYTDYDSAVVRDSQGWPGGNLNLAGAAVCVIESVSITNSSGIVAAAVTSDGYVRIYGGAPRMNWRRNTAAGGNHWLDSPASYTYSGAIVGSFNWSTVPTKPQAISGVRTARSVQVTITGSASDGGATISAYKVQRAESTDGVSWGGWTDEQDISGGSYTYNNLTPGKYHKFRTYANNVRGSSEARETSAIFVPAGGKRRAAGVFASTTIARRRAGGVWVDLSTAKRKPVGGGAMVDLS